MHEYVTARRCETDEQHLQQLMPVILTGIV